jgi:hypothetical protein
MPVLGRMYSPLSHPGPFLPHPFPQPLFRAPYQCTPIAGRRDSHLDVILLAALLF